MSRRASPRFALVVALVAGSASLFTAAALRWSVGAWEDRALRDLAAEHAPPGMDEAERVLALLHLSHRLVDSANRYWRSQRPDRSQMLLGPPIHRLLVEGGTCGSFSVVLARLLILSGFDARLAVVRGSAVSGHTVVTARVHGRWVPLDPLFDLVFRDASGRLASLSALGSDWPRYAAQTPPDYRPEFDYRTVRFTNWERIPILLPVVRRAAEAVFGSEAVEHFSLRIYLTNVPKVEAVLLAGAGLGALAGAGVLRRSGREPRARSGADAHPGW